MSTEKGTPTPNACPTCDGETVRFRGSGFDTEFWVCPDFRKPGHLDAETIRRRIAERREAIGKGRFS